jgi:ATP-dependent DNA helicase RecQ
MPEWISAPVDSSSTLAADSSRGHQTGKAKQPGAPSNGRKSVISGDAALVNPEMREYLREWRRGAAQEESVPAFVVMHDTSLDELCRKQPKSIAELLTVSGFGKHKAETYGLKILEALNKFRAGARAGERVDKISRPAEETIRLLREGNSLEEVARIRGRQLGSIASLVADLIQEGALELQPDWVAPAKRIQIQEACAKLGIERLRPIKDALPADIAFEDIRLVVAQIRRQQQQADETKGEGPPLTSGATKTHQSRSRSAQ